MTPVQRCCWTRCPLSGLFPTSHATTPPPSTAAYLVILNLFKSFPPLSISSTHLLPFSPYPRAGSSQAFSPNIVLVPMPSSFWSITLSIFSWPIGVPPPPSQHLSRLDLWMRLQGGRKKSLFYRWRKKKKKKKVSSDEVTLPRCRESLKGISLENLVSGKSAYAKTQAYAHKMSCIYRDKGCSSKLDVISNKSYLVHFYPCSRDGFDNWKSVGKWSAQINWLQPRNSWSL